ncbi:hypothetical protein AAB988_35740 [Burkholderia contaminans]|uniref:hypothetical protein n=1 Tax=Burkholderia contaminans TaxID=488447 RepID=UPI0031160424
MNYAYRRFPGWCADDSFHPDENGIHMHVTFNQDSNPVDLTRKQNHEIADSKVATKMNARGFPRNSLAESVRKNGAGSRGQVMRVRRACRDGSPDGARRTHSDRPGMPINRMKTGR